MKAAKLRQESMELLSTELTVLLREQFSLRMQHATNHLTQTSAIKRVRRDIARVRTVMAEKRRVQDKLVEGEGTVDHG